MVWWPAGWQFVFIHRETSAIARRGTRSASYHFWKTSLNLPVRRTDQRIGGTEGYPLTARGKRALEWVQLFAEKTFSNNSFQNCTKCHKKFYFGQKSVIAFLRSD